MSNACFAGDLPAVKVDSSPLDTRSYRALTLPNKLKVLLVTDKDSDNAAAAINVAVGHFSDPNDRPGIAHFCEHMLYMGTAKYPDEGSFRQFVAENGGSTNAYTYLEDTNYHFQITVKSKDEDGHSRKKIYEALDRFSQLFAAPLFTESAVDREVKAVDSENEKNLQSDHHRLGQLHKSTVNPEHPYHKFATGSKETLDKEDSREVLLRFHDQYYSADIMTLTLVAPLDLDCLQKYAVELFSDIKNKNIQHPSLAYRDIPVFYDHQLRRMFYVCPIKDIRMLTITWLIPPEHTTYRSKPAVYISHLVGHEGKGSALTLLKKRCWANEMWVCTSRTMKFNSFFEIGVALTVEGLGHTDEIIELIYGYLALIRKEGVQKWIYNECKAVADMGFRFRERGEPIDLAISLSSGMRYYEDPKVYLTGPALFFEYSEKEIRNVLNHLTPQKANVFVSSKTFKDIALEKERWYGTPYKVEEISPAKIEAWSSAIDADGLTIPPKNEFIPTNFDLIGEPLGEGEKDEEGPILILQEGHFKVHYKLDRTFRRPKAGVYFEFETPYAYYSPRYSVFANFYTQMLEDSLTEYSYDAKIAGLAYKIRNTWSGVQLVVRGFSHHLDRLLFAIIRRMRELVVDPERFLLVKDQLQCEFSNFAKDQPYHHAMYAMNYGMEQPRWHIRSYLEELDSTDVNPDTLKKFIPRLLSRMHVECLVHGNLDQEWASNLASEVKRIIGFEPLRGSERVNRRIVMLPKGVTSTYSQETANPDDSNSAVEVYYQVGRVDDDIRLSVTLDILAEIVDKPAFHELRTKQQLGYMVFSGIRHMENVAGLRFIVQSTVATPDDLEERIETFVEEFLTILKSLSPEEFRNFVNAQIAKRQEQERRLSTQGNRFWAEISHHQYMWNRRELEVQELRKLTLTDVLDLYQKCVQKNGDNRRKLISKVYGGTTVISKGESYDTETIEITDPIEFRRTLPLWPCGGRRI